MQHSLSFHVYISYSTMASLGKTNERKKNERLQSQFAALVSVLNALLASVSACP